MRQPRDTARGFTLVELLVVMVLLSLLMLGMVSALYSSAQTQARVDDRLQRQDQLRTISHFLRQTLEHVVVRDWRHPDLPTGARLRGMWVQPGSVQWVGIMPARPGVGGPHFFRLALEERDGASALVLRYRPWQTGTGDEANTFPNWGDATARVLIAPVTRFDIQAKGDWPLGAAAADWPSGWQNDWPLKAENPSHIQLNISDAQGAWPPLVVSVRPSASDNSGGAVIGGSR